MSLENDDKFWTAVGQKELAGTFSSLLRAGLSPNAVHEPTGLTPLHVACREGDCALAMLLFTKGTLVNTQDKAGQTPLHLAAQGGHGQIVTFLVKAGADVSLLNQQQQLAEELAFQQKHTAVFRFLLNARLGNRKEMVNVRMSLIKEEKGRDKEQKLLERQERKLMEKDHALKQELMELAVEKTRLEAIPAHLVSKREKDALAQIERQLAKLDIKHQRCVRDIKEVRRSSFEPQNGHEKSQAWLNFFQKKVSFS